MTAAERSRLLIALGSAAALLFFLHLLGILNPVETAAGRLLALVERPLSASAVSLRDGLTAQFRAGTLVSENAALKRERDALLVQVAGLESLRDENAALNALLKFTQRAVRPPVLAHVLAALPESGLHALAIDQGTDAGLAVDQPVVVGDGLLVGKIIEVKRSSATVLLLTDTRSRVSAAVQNSGRTQGIIQGQRGLSLKMNLIPQNEDVHPGDLVVTAGLEPLMPRGLVIGRLQDVISQERDPFKAATVASPVEFDRLTVVAVVVP